MSIRKYFSDAVRELHNVTWPTRRQTIFITVAVLFFVLISAGFVGGTDYGITVLLDKFI